MPRIVLLAVGAAFFPALLACVAILISRPEPRRLIFAFYLGGLLMSLVSGVFVLRAFEGGEEVAGSTAHSPHGGVSIGVGVVGLLFAWLIISRRGHALLDSWRRRHPSHHAPRKREGPSWVERRLGAASAKIAFVVGAAINLPGPFYLLALGDLSSGFSTGEQVVAILLFNAIMFLLLEIPLVGYLIDPEWTESAVAGTGSWLNANGMRVVGAIVAVFSVSFVVQGILAIA
jgi:hypothetical protein